MFKIDKTFLKRLKYSKVLTEEAFVSITSLLRIITVIVKLIHEESKF